MSEFEHPLYFNDPKPIEGIVAAAFLVCIPLAASLSGRLGEWLCDRGADGAMLGAIIFYAFSVGFSISALRQPLKSERVWEL